MHRVNHLKAKLKIGRRPLGCMISLPSADVAEIMALAGFDFLLIDQEHGPGLFGDAVAQMRAAKGGEVASLVRVPPHAIDYVQRVLDAGADGVVFPGVESAAQAERMVRACFYPPRGTRGVAGGLRALGYGFDPDHYARLREDLLIVVQVESVRGVEQIGEICKIAEIDVVMIGPRDLSASIGKLNQFNDPDLMALMQQAESGVLASAKFLASVIYPGLSLQAMFDRGYHMLIAGNDIGFLVQGARAVLAERPGQG